MKTDRRASQATIMEVAIAAGVSLATVSRTTNHPEKVKPETREKIERIIKEKGYKIFSSDLEVTRLYTTLPVKKELIKIFGEQVLNDNLTISKEYIKNAIFTNPELKKKLEDFIHPLVKNSIKAFINKSKTDKLIFIEVPLMFEQKIYTLFDYILSSFPSS